MANQKQQYIWLPTLLALLFIIGVLVGTFLDNNAPFISVKSSNEAFPSLGQGKIEEILRYVDAKYVDVVEQGALMSQAVESVIDDLDPHSNYISAEELQSINEQLAGNFEGIGIEFMMLDDTLVVVTALPEGPSHKAGILSGDKIITVEDSTVSGVNKEVEEITQQLRGAKGTQVTIGILRKGISALKEVSIIRNEIPINSVDVAYEVKPGIGYIKINRFSASTYQEFMQHLERLVEEENIKDLILDLRNNPGGYLQQATKILSQLFKEKDKLLVYTEGRAVKKTEYRTSGRNFFSIDNIAVLINEGSASASEIIAGAIQDLDRGMIVGRRSFGKGLVQEQYNLNDGSALRLTVARYYTPSGRSIQRDYQNSEGYQNDLANRYEHGEFVYKDSVEVIDSLKFRTSKGRLVYGGGGITPDVFVPIDTTYFEPEFIAYQNIIPAYVFRYIEQHTEILNVNEEENISSAFFDDFLIYAEQKGIISDSTQIEMFRPALNRSLKARLAKQINGNDDYYKVWNQKDRSILKAIEVLQSEDPLKLRALK